MKKLFSCLAAFVMMLAAATSTAVFAAENYTITITNTSQTVSIKAGDYAAYKIFDVTYSGQDSEGNPTAYSYTITESSPWYDFVKTGEGKVYVTLEPTKVDGTYTVTRNASEEESSYEAFAKAALKYQQENEISEVAKNGTVTETGSTENKNRVQTTTIDVTTNGGAGYYLVFGTGTAATSETVTAAVILTTTQPTASVDAKIDAPSADKTIVEADKDNGKGSAYNVGDTVPFKVVSAVPNTTGYTAYTMTFTDTMSPGLTYNANSLTVKIGETTYTQDQFASNGITYETNVNNKTFVVTIEVVYRTAEGTTVHRFDDRKSIELNYSATLNSGALTTDKETNTINLEYSSNPNDSTDKSTTPPSTVYVYDFDIVIDKYAGNNENTSDTSKKLSGAKFILYKKVTENEAEVTKYYKVDDATKVVTWVNSADEATVVTTDENGAASFKGLDTGTYFLHETEAPAGYNLLTADVEVTITATYGDDGQITVSSATSTNNGQYSQTSQVKNNTGTELPGTGGSGTTWIYAAGGILILGSVIGLLTRRKMREN